MCIIFTQAFDTGSPVSNERPQSAKMAAPVSDAGEFKSWLNDRLDSLEVDREVYGAYIVGILQEEDSDEEKKDALQGIFSAFVVNISSGMSCFDTVAMCLHICCCLSVFDHRVDQVVVLMSARFLGFNVSVWTQQVILN